MRQVEATPGRTLLEVGSGSRGIARYISARWEMTACDVNFSDYEAPAVGEAGQTHRVEASVLQMPFADESFDVVVALDLLEHLAAKDRPQALTQLRRVAGQLLIVGCPTGVDALRSDERLACFYQRIRRPVPLWLEEHLRNGFPEITMLTEHLREDGGELVVMANEALLLHAFVSRLEALPVLWRLTAGFSSILTVGLNNRLWRGAVCRVLALLRLSDRPPTYRTIAVLSKRLPTSIA